MPHERAGGRYPGVEIPASLARALFADSPFSTVIYDPGGHPLAVNRAFERLWGVTLETVPPGYSVLADPEKLEKVFEPFVQVGRALNHPSEGVGLGLAISRDLARGMGGDLSAESGVGAGSTFTLVLPRAKGA